jgi:hypothetical protein
MSEIVKVVTQAPKDYDYGWSKEVNPNFGVDHRGRTLRLVEIPKEYHGGQMMRYGSGLHFCCILGTVEYYKEVEAGYILLSAGGSNDNS